MSDANPIGRMATRGGAKEKMSKVVAMLRSIGIAEEPEEVEDHATMKNVKKSRSKAKNMTKKAKDDTVKKPASASELAAIEDAFLKKAEAGHLNHPRHWTDNVPHNVTCS